MDITPATSLPQIEADVVFVGRGIDGRKYVQVYWECQMDAGELDAAAVTFGHRCADSTESGAFVTVDVYDYRTPGATTPE